MDLGPQIRLIRYCSCSVGPKVGSIYVLAILEMGNKLVVLERCVDDALHLGLR